VSCSGNITVTVTWNGPNPPPSQALVFEKCNPIVEAYSGPATATDGIYFYDTPTTTAKTNPLFTLLEWILMGSFLLGLIIFLGPTVSGDNNDVN
jgi:hypothetical protein